MPKNEGKIRIFSSNRTLILPIASIISHSMIEVLPGEEM